MTDVEPTVAEWNCQHVNLNLATIGSITPNMRAIWLDRHEGGWVPCFILAKDSELDRECIEDILVEFETFQLALGAVAGFEIVISEGDIARIEYPARVIYRRREW